MVYRFAIILTHNRPVNLAVSANTIAHQANRVIIVDNASSPPVSSLDFPDIATIVLRDETQPPNLAALMNLGLDFAEQMAADLCHDRWDIAMLCDDVVVPDGWYEMVAGQIRLLDAIAGSTHQIQPVAAPLVKRGPDNDIHNRMQGSAFVLRGESKLRADEGMHWWWQDTDLDWQARQAGGMVIAPGPVAVNTKPNDFTNSKPELAARAGQDQAYFKQKWGWVPW